MRPASIVNFERLYLGSFVVGLINSFLTWDDNIARLKAQSNGAEVNPSLLYFGLVAGVVITLLLWYFVARKASVIAKWILVVFFAIGLIGIALMLAQGRFPGGIGAVLTVVSTLMQAAAVWMLFRPDAVAWFADGRG